MDKSSSTSRNTPSSSRNDSPTTSSSAKSSKKRSRNSVNGDESLSRTKQPKLADSHASPSSIDKSHHENDASLSLEETHFRIMVEKTLQKGDIYVASCGGSKCPGFSSDAPGGLESTPDALNWLELESKLHKKCGQSLLSHDIGWCADVGPKQKDGVAPRIQRLFAMVVCTRWMCTYWNKTRNTFKWIHILITRLQKEIEDFNTVMKNRVDARPSPVLKTLLSSLSDASTSTLSKASVSSKICSNFSTFTSSADAHEALETRISVLCALDNLFYLLYHYSLVSPLASSSKPSATTSTTSNRPKNADSMSTKPETRKKLSILSPVDYFKLFFDPVSEHVLTLTSKFWKHELDRITRKRAQQSVGTLQDALDASNSNPLLAIWHLRFMEYIRFYYATGLAKESKAMEHAIATQISSSGGAARGKKASKIKRVRLAQQSKEHASEPICSEGLQLWRDVSRDWPSLLYAYAVPTPHALDTITEFGPVVEIGAGTGYWANLLKERGVKVMAFDSVPTTTAGEQNEFHANVPPFFDVMKAGTAAVKKFSDHSLFLCFPPPDDPMALDAVRTYTGRYVIHVGEWEGFTGTVEFEAHLFQHFTLVRRVELPNWHDTCYDLTVWERRKVAPNTATETSNTAQTPSSSSSSALRPLVDSPLTDAHAHLKTVQCFNCGKISSVLRRCKCCRMAAFCSKGCASHGSRQHTSVHALHGIFTSPVDSVLDYNQTKHYRVLRTKEI